MAFQEILAEGLITGQQMTREEFLRRLEALSDLKHAELIEGRVFVPSPLDSEHARFGGYVIGWLSLYGRPTPGCKIGGNGTWIMLDSAPQPDVYLEILPEFGGQWRVEGEYGSGAPELVVEICETDTEVDFGPKLGLYERAGVLEYVTLELLAKKIVWRALEGGSYRELTTGPDGSYRSLAFPGLWLNPAAFWSSDTAAMKDMLQQGLASEEHVAFVQQLTANYRG